MAPATKKAPQDDFVLTLSDNEEDLSKDFEEEIPASPPLSNKKRKRASESTSTPKKNKKSKKGNAHDSDGEVEPNEGIWGAKDEDDGAMDSDFEFALEGGEGRMEDFEGWGFEGAKKGLNGVSGGDKRAVDIDDIIARRREKKNGEKVVVPEANEDTTAGDSDDQDVEDVEALELENSGDEFMAEDGFGMGAGSADEDSDDQQDVQDPELSGEDGEDDGSDNESVASAVPHPDDEVPEASSDEEDNDEDPEEAARREAFFAPEEKPAKGSKQTTNLSFQTMSLSRPILRGLAAVGFTQPTPIQAKTIPVALLGKDVVGGAVTGSGKTGAFIVPVLERLLYRPKKVPTSRVVILMPTRELAIQCHAVATKLASHTDIKFCLAVGGLSLKVQEAELRLRPDVIIATPGRFIDHMRNSPSFTVDTLEILVLDEADRMLEAGFADELNEILTTIPKSRQTMLFSATMTSSVDNLIRVGLNRPVRILVDAQKQTVGTLIQEFIRLRPGRETKRMGYLLYLCANVYTDRVIVFFRQKKEAHRARVIFGLSGLKATELHGSMSQEQRIISVEAFRDGKASFLLATDLASRGLDIKGVDTVINYEAPQSHEIYLHRVGRTARAGRQGRACTLAAEPDRKIVKAAVKSGRSQGAKIVSRVIEAADADTWAEKVEEMQDEIEEILKEEKEDKQLAQVEMQVRKGENMINHEDEIKGRPKRTWFESEVEKTAAKKAGRAELNGVESILKKKPGKLSNKDKKKLDDRDVRMEGKVWKKGRAERDGKGALAKAEKGKKKMKGGKPPGKPTKGKFGKKR
ncbi:P-loop containing nucleoside triphosphate hydrolase [Glarea lozoyensis ATCC 20868]|uniref:RNA helicase n=1 Tax=Glarea lozoyensis (strain ATCC 20868 / MF5171) TaxID=1116229 RepID=S3ECU3_GLAL2|nr:P-loop containing nucleoside triphosphate hydrolase [Glarea lozoyensis ATCC 20868]EPE36123.1 P-loop containing nucleoside triphosphate hydrolase [Glarea lozoyensis ATCC 20868]